MKKMMTCFASLIYVMLVCFLISVYGGEKLFFFVWIAVGLICVLLAMAFANLFISFKYCKKDDHDIIKYSMIFKLALIPFYVINFIFGIIFIIGGAMVWFFALTLAFLVVLMYMFTYVMMASSSVYTVIYLFRNKNRSNIALIIIHIVLHFIFVVDVIDSVYLYCKSRQNKSINT